MEIRSFTPSKLQESCQSQLLSLGNSLLKNTLTIEDIGDYIPGSVMVQENKVA